MVVGAALDFILSLYVVLPIRDFQSNNFQQKILIYKVIRALFTSFVPLILLDTQGKFIPR